MVYLSRIYTKTGDTGDTGLGDGSRVPKDHPRVTAYGSVDETNSCIGTVLALWLGFQWGPVTAYSLMGTLLTIMILPIIAALSRRCSLAA